MLCVRGHAVLCAHSRQVTGSDMDQRDRILEEIVLTEASYNEDIHTVGEWYHFFFFWRGGGDGLQGQ